jgi:signal transduction histidine kinase
MILKNKLSIYLIILFSVANSFAQSNNSISKAHKYLLENKIDSLDIVLKDIPNTIENSYFKNIRLNKASYLDFVSLLSGYTLTDKKHLLQLNQLVNNKVKEPTNIEKINLNFVKVKWFQILTLLNDEKIDLAATESKKLSSYISRIKQKNNTEYKKAIIYARLFPIVTLMIQKDIKEGKKLCLLSLQEAEKLQDDFLTIFSKNYLNEFLVLEDDLDEFIKNCKEIFVLEAKQKQKTIFYEPNIQHYLDAVIYKGNFDEIEVENLLNKLYENSKYSSYILYAKYMEYSTSNPLACKRIYTKFKVNNLTELCSFFVTDAKEKLNLNDLNSLYDECSDAFFTHKIFDQAYKYKEKEANLTRKIYSQELSQSLADFETQEKDLENAKLKQVNSQKEAKLSRQKTIILGISIGLLIFTILSYFLYNTIQQRNKINSKLDIANKDLNRLNVLNQKIFSVISHDFKGPILTLSMLLNTFKKNTKDSYIAENINELSTQFDNANNILNNLLNWAKAEINIQIEENPKSNVKQIATEIINQLETTAKNKNITFNCEIPENSNVNLPADILRIIFRNLLTNAIKFSYENNQIKVVFNDTTHQLLITDYGLGIEADRLNNLFQKDVISSFGTKNEPGFGMGLYIISELLHKYKASISVKSELNKETTFTTTFHY